ncbi:MAG: hypothetical protein JNK51_08320 [Blastocatellia bacterium]|nr:hypothetical protein [Chloracidobacterium sp.]MBL8184916.1 hypothetical protein [Blastocatellia bacterium]
MNTRSTICARALRRMSRPRPTSPVRVSTADFSVNHFSDA